MSDQTIPGEPPAQQSPQLATRRYDADELLRQKIADALRDGKSERHIAKLLGISRMVFWRDRLLFDIARAARYYHPDDKVRRSPVKLAK